MIKQNQKKISDSKIKNKPGGHANESAFGGDLREMRTKKLMVVPSINTGSSVKLEQGWNSYSKKKDVVRVTINKRGEKKRYALVERAELEQALCMMCQGDEVVKYSAPTIS